MASSRCSKSQGPSIEGIVYMRMYIAWADGTVRLQGYVVGRLPRIRSWSGPDTVLHGVEDLHSVLLTDALGIVS